VSCRRPAAAAVGASCCWWCWCCAEQAKDVVVVGNGRSCWWLRAGSRCYCWCWCSCRQEVKWVGWLHSCRWCAAERVGARPGTWRRAPRWLDACVQRLSRRQLGEGVIPAALCMRTCACGGVYCHEDAAVARAANTPRAQRDVPQRRGCSSCWWWAVCVCMLTPAASTAESAALGANRNCSARNTCATSGL
jgi:hypothetical protein